MKGYRKISYKLGWREERTKHIYDSKLQFPMSFFFTTPIFIMVHYEKRFQRSYLKFNLKSKCLDKYLIR